MIKTIYTAILLVALAIQSPAFAQNQRKGGEFVFAQEASPPTLDMHTSTSISSRNIAMNVFEMLVTRNEVNDVINEIAESVDVSEGGLVYTFKIRAGLQFHNGKSLTAADVKASFDRYKRIGLGRAALASVTSMEAPDAQTFVIRLSTKTPVFLEEISSFTSPIVILPAEETDKSAGQIELIGSGPYQVTEWVRDNHVKLKRFENYKPDSRYKGNEGFGGRKVAYFDTVTFRFLSEPETRVAALETGEVHAVEDVPTKAAIRLRRNKNVALHNLKDWWIHAAWVHHEQPPTNNLLVRRAIQIALDMEEIMDVATDGAYQLQPGLQYPGNPYYVTDGKEFYNVNDRVKARELLKEAGYKNEQLVLMTNSSFPSMNTAALVVSERLKSIGMNVKLEVLDWSSAMARLRQKDAGWNLWFTGHASGPAAGPFTAVRNFVSPNPYQFKADPIIDDLYKKMVAGETLQERIPLFAAIQKRAYEQVMFVKFGDLSKVQATRSNVVGFAPYRIPRAWNVSFQ